VTVTISINILELNLGLRTSNLGRITGYPI